MELLSEIICPHGMSHQQYADDTQLYISILGQVNDAADVLLGYLEPVGAWMGNNRWQLNSGKMEWLYIQILSLG